MALIAKKYIGKKFGKYTFQVCPETNFLEAKGMLSIYNSTAAKKKQVGKMNEYMGRSTFKKSVFSDFDKISKDSKLDLGYLKQLCEKNSGMEKSFHFPPEDSDPKAILEIMKLEEANRDNNIW
jgi:hypothetical protein